MHGPQALANTVADVARSESHLAVALDGGAHLLRARGDQERAPPHSRRAPMRLLGHVRGAAHVLVGGVGAAADERRRDRVDKLFFACHLGGELRSDGHGLASAGRRCAAPASERSIVYDAVEVTARDRPRPRVGREERAVLVASQLRPARPGQCGEVASPCARRLGSIEVVAPSSAPMLVMVALPVALIERAPGPKYSMMALVPPDTVSSPAMRITSFGRCPAAHLAGQVDAR